MSRGADLYSLQSLDSEEDSLRRRLEEVVAALADDAALREARQAVETATTQARKLAVRQRDLELEIQTVSDKIARAEKRLYSGAVKNPKELSDLQAEAASLRRRRQKLEDDLLEVMIASEEAEDVLAAAQSHLQETEARWESRQADLRAEQETIQARLTEIAAAREALIPRLPPADWEDYRLTRQRKGGLAVVRLHNGACGGCGIAISPSLEWQLRQEGVIHCRNCGRIIIRET